MHGEDAARSQPARRCCGSASSRWWRRTRDRPSSAPARSGIPLVARFIARRIVDADAGRTRGAGRRHRPRRRRRRPACSKACATGSKGGSTSPAPPNWPAVYARLQRAARSDRGSRGDSGAAVWRHRSRARAAWRSFATDRRRSTNAGARCRRWPASAGRSWPASSPSLIDDRSLRVDAIRAIAALRRRRARQAARRAIPDVQRRREGRGGADARRRARATAGC